MNFEEQKKTILDLLKESNRLNLREIHKQTGISYSAVVNIINALESNKEIKSEREIINGRANRFVSIV